MAHFVSPSASRPRRWNSAATASRTARGLRIGANRIGGGRLRPFAGIPGLDRPPGQPSQVRVLNPDGPAVRQQVAQRVEVVGKGKIDSLDHQGRLQRPFPGRLRVPADVTRADDRSASRRCAASRSSAAKRSQRPASRAKSSGLLIDDLPLAQRRAQDAADDVAAAGDLLVLGHHDVLADAEVVQGPAHFNRGATLVLDLVHDNQQVDVAPTVVGAAREPKSRMRAGWKRTTMRSTMVSTMAWSVIVRPGLAGQSFLYGCTGRLAL